MTSAQQAARRQGEHYQAEQLAGQIRRQVLRALGTPPGWFSVSVRPLWDRFFRVNVLIGESATSFAIGHSYFLVTDGAGQMLESNPAIVRTYSSSEGGAE
jgi:hypothetical protein